MKKRLLIKVETTVQKKGLGASEATDSGSFLCVCVCVCNKLGTGKNLTDVRVVKKADRSGLFSRY